MEEIRAKILKITGTETTGVEEQNTLASLQERERDGHCKESLERVKVVTALEHLSHF